MLQAKELSRIAREAREKLKNEERIKRYAEEDAKRLARKEWTAEKNLSLPPIIESGIKAAAESGENSYFYVWTDLSQDHWPCPEVIEFLQQKYPDLNPRASQQTEVICTNYETDQYGNVTHRGILFTW